MTEFRVGEIVRVTDAGAKAHLLVAGDVGVVEQIIVQNGKMYLRVSFVTRQSREDEGWYPHRFKSTGLFIDAV